MKKININFIGADDGYDEVSGGNRYDKWDFTKPDKAILECVLMERRAMPNQKGAGTYDLYTVIHAVTKKPYVVFCAKVLEDKLKNIPLYSLVKIVFEGTHPTKRYYLFKVHLNRNFKYDPAQFNLDDYAEVKSESQPVNTTPGTGAAAKQPVQQTEEDFPF